MCKSRNQLLLKLQSLINRHRGATNFVANMDEWPKTIKELVFNSEPLMIRLGMLMPLSGGKSSGQVDGNSKDILTNCKAGDHNLIVVMAVGPEMERTVLRWCRVCGSVVGDLQCDNTVSPGAVFKMKSPAAWVA